MVGTRVASPVFREGDEVVLAEGPYQGTLGVFLRQKRTSTGRISPSATAASAATRWYGWRIPPARPQGSMPGATQAPSITMRDRLHKKVEANSIMNIRPLYDRIVVKRIEEQETTRNGIVIPDSAKEKPQEGEVMAVGHGKRLEDGKLVALDVKVGDRILFGKYSGNETKLDGTEYIIMREDDVLGVLDAAAQGDQRRPA